MGLRERLIEVMAGAVGTIDYHLASSAQRAREAESLTDSVLAVVVAWLRDEAARYRVRAEKADSSTLMTMLTIRADTLSKAADSITGSTDATH